MSSIDLTGWDRLRHGGLLLDTRRLPQMADHVPDPLSAFYERELRRQASALLEGRLDVPSFATLVLEKICGFNAESGTWQRGTQVGAKWTRRAVTGEGIKPRQLWHGSKGGLLPVFFDSEKRIGIGRGRKTVSLVLQWLRAGDERLAMITNGRQWRLVFAGLDFDAWCEWDVDLWFEEGILSSQVTALRTLLSSALWIPTQPHAPAPLLQAILDSRKGQAELSTVLGERVREAVELLVQAHGEVLKEKCATVNPSDIYRTAVRVVMRMVIALFAESRELLPCNNTLYHTAYGLTGLLETLEKLAARGTNRLTRSWSAWPRVLALFRLVYQGSHHQELAVPAYGGELFTPGNAETTDGLVKSLAVFENACFERELMCDRDVLRMFELITRTRVKVRQGRSSTWMPAPVDFSDLSSEYIGILYEGLLDFELKTAPTGDPIVFLAIGNQPALPLSRLEAMDDKALANLLEKMKDTNSGEEKAEVGETEESLESDEAADAEEVEEVDEVDENLEDKAVEREAASTEDERHTTRTRAEKWARHAVEVGKLAKIPRGKMTPEKKLVYEETVAVKARRLVTRVVLPGEWYLVRWGGTRKGAGTFYTRPGLAVPTVQRTLRPLAFDPPVDSDGKPDLEASAGTWTPKKPEDILALKVCDPACGSGTFPVAALRFLTDALYTSLHHHGRIRENGDRTVVALLSGIGGTEERLSHEFLPCNPDDALFEPRLKAVLRRHVVERCLYGVDLDPLAVELCRLSLWIETMDRELPFSFLDHKIKCGNSLVGSWFDQFQHYPVMAWKNREGGDKGHNNGMHFQKEGRTKAIKAWVKEVLASDLEHAIIGQLRIGETSWEGNRPEKVHNQALTLLERLHELPVQDTTERSRIWHDEFLGSENWRSLKASMDLWCSCWFWPADDLEHAPLATTFTALPAETIAVAERIAAAKRFFHWELEFPDVFRSEGSGFDAVLGNPPWDIAKPNSKEFFSNIDPLYRSYGKQEALRFQSGYFQDPKIEGSWIDYCADFRAQSNFMSYAASPFGDPNENEKSQHRFSIRRGKQNMVLHDLWRDARAKSRGFADPRHPFRYQGSADINLYKLFIEQTHTLLRKGGRLGFIVPSGLYSDHGTGSLRRLFLDHCRWEWLFGFENRDGIFEIHRSYKFNPVIIEKGGKTEAIHTAFMRRRLEDWERAEALATPYSRVQVDHFSPRSKAILEIQSQRDLDILEKIYANSVLLGDDGPDGWAIKYATEFHMTNDSKLFPPRPKWESEGYRPDEYSRWLKGAWRPIAELWSELGVDLGRPVPLSPKAEAAIREADVLRGDHSVRCAQPPYDRLPVPRADIPVGIILSREADAWIREEQVEDVALPLYEGRMIGQFDFSQKGWVSGKGRSAVWRDVDWISKRIEPQYLIRLNTWREEALSAYLKSFATAFGKDEAEDEKERLTDPEQFDLWWWARRRKVAFIDVTSATNTRTMFSAVLAELPCGNSAPVLNCDNATVLPAVLNSLSYDMVARLRCGGVHLNWFVIEESILPPNRELKESLLSGLPLALGLGIERMAEFWIKPGFDLSTAWRICWALSDAERLRMRCALDTVITCRFGLDFPDIAYLLEACDYQNPAESGANPKGFWRVDKDKDPELRHTVLTLVAFHDLEEKISACGGDREEGIEAFLNQNDGEGWMLPETLRLADYGLGHDERAKEHQPVASRLGPRFYDWQLAQSPEESWRECHLHARNLLGKKGYLNLLADVLRDTALGGWGEALAFACELSTKDNFLTVFTAAIGQLPPDEWQDRLDEVRAILSERGFSLDAADMIQILVKALRRTPEEVCPEGLSVARELVGETGYRQLLADLEAGDHGKIAESVEPYGTSTGKMTQRWLFD